jgi:excinuclease ABC subunit A
MNLVDAGNTVVVIEHNMDVIKVADHIIDLGPEGGDEGGTIIAQGTPEQVAATPGSYTGLYLKEVLESDKGYQPFSIDTEQVATVALSDQTNTTPTRERRKVPKATARRSASRLN